MFVKFVVKIYILYLYENVFYFLLYKFNQTFFKVHMESDILGHPALYEMMHVLETSQHGGRGGGHALNF